MIATVFFLDGGLCDESFLEHLAGGEVTNCFDFWERVSTFPLLLVVISTVDTRLGMRFKDEFFETNLLEVISSLLLSLSLLLEAVITEDERGQIFSSFEG